MHPWLKPTHFVGQIMYYQLRRRPLQATATPRPLAKVPQIEKTYHKNIIDVYVYGIEAARRLNDSIALRLDLAKRGYAEYGAERSVCRTASDQRTPPAQRFRRMLQAQVNEAIAATPDLMVAVIEPALRRYSGVIYEQQVTRASAAIEASDKATSIRCSPGQVNHLP